MILKDYSPEFAKLLSTDSTDSSFDSKVPTTTEPTGAGVLDLSGTNIQYKQMVFVPFGGDAANETFLMRVIGWKAVGTLWVPVILMQATCTLGNVPGVDGSEVEDELFFCDTIVVATPATSTRAVATSPATDSINDVIGHVIVDLDGMRKVEVTFNLNSSSASCNTLYAAK